MCKYCEELEIEFEVLNSNTISCGFMGKAIISLDMYKEKGKVNLYANLLNCDGGCETAKIEINFCPFCGRKLIENKGE